MFQAKSVFELRKASRVLDNHDLMDKARACTHCAAHLPLGPRPIVRATNPNAPIVLIGQAPGTKVHASGIPWDDASGKRLRDWLGLDAASFYNESQIAIMPMGFCYPGKTQGGDAPPRPECAPLWHDRILQALPRRRLTILIGSYALARYLGPKRASTLAETVMAWRSHIEDGFFPLVHPSPRNQNWLKQNPWFEADVVPALQARVKIALANG
jgi:uracil-DNA glycosylase